MINSRLLKQVGVIIFSLATLISCGGGDGGEDPAADALGKAVLISPLNEEECNQGNIISNTQSTVTFEWNAAKNATRYTVLVINLNDNSTKELNTEKLTVSGDLLRGVPYSWRVIAKKSGSRDFNESETWRFFNAGEAIESYAPFAASLVEPTMGSIIETSTTLSWTGSDVDNDIDSYDVYLSKTNPPTTLKGNTTDTTIDTGALDANSVYYWRVITKDKAENSSQSTVFQFRTK